MSTHDQPAEQIATVSPDQVVVRPGEAHDLPPTEAAVQVSLNERRAHQVVAMGGGDVGRSTWPMPTC